MFGRIGLAELIFIFLVVFLLFGAKAMPEIAKGLAQAIKIFKREAREIQQDLESDPAEQATASAVERITDNSNDYVPDSAKRNWREDIGSNEDAEKKEV